jgi:outer membrane protein OmpA-like peptidoglycan-associated protein
VRKLALAILPLLAAACATGGKLRADGDIIRSDISKAEASGAYKCAPRELALAKAHVEFGENEIDEGDAVRAQEHMTFAEQNVKKALLLSKECGPKTVTIKESTQPPTKPPMVVKIEKVDTDGDGIPDDEDRCPEQAGPKDLQGCPDRDGDGVPDIDDKCPDKPGPKENQGCPISKDTDGDGIPDDVDKCPFDAEDFDGFQDEDGCPDPDNDNDGIVDKMDKCPNEPGPIENQGCPVRDRDGDGVPDDKDKCPDVPGKAEFDGCPDTDGDGIPDAQDKCPLNPGPKENDGCPDTDRDHDGVVDRLDKCPDDPGLPPDGCPKKYTLVEIKKDRIEIKQQVHFATKKFKILPDSYGLLDQVVQVLKDYPKMKVRVEGHTDNVGGETFNLKLSQQRADAVRDYLVKKGVDEDRLESMGFGLTKPIAANKTEKGRAQNRRTEFHIISME